MLKARRRREERRKEKRGGGEGSTVEKEERWGRCGQAKGSRGEGGERGRVSGQAARGQGERVANHRPAILTCSTVIYELHPKEAAFAATMLRKREFHCLNPNSSSTRRKRHKSPLLRVPGAALCPGHQLQNLSTDHHSNQLFPLPFFPSFLLFTCNIIGFLLFLLPHSLLVAPSFLRSKVK